jgi:hypothetical protein
LPPEKPVFRAEQIGPGIAGLLVDAVLATELVNATGSVNDLLLARIEGVAFGAHFHLQIFAERRSGGEFVATTTGYFDIRVVGMNVSFHWCSPEPLNCEKVA